MRRLLVEQAESTEVVLADLVARSRDGDTEAWHELWLALAPLVENMARRGALTGPLSRCPDARRDIVVRVMEELHEDGFRRLSELGERLARRDGSFQGWILVIARNVAVSHVRAHAEYLGAGEEGGQRWAEHVPLKEAPKGASLPSSREIEGREIFERSVELLDPAQRDALGLWLQGDDFAEIAAALQLPGGAGAATRLVRSAVARLRARFAGGERCATDTPRAPDRRSKKIVRRA